MTGRSSNISNWSGHLNSTFNGDAVHPMIFVRAWKIDWLPNILHGEMLAIAECLHVALGKARRGEFNGRVRVFTDSRVALEILSQVRIVDMIRVSGLFDEILLTIVEAIIWHIDE